MASARRPATVGVAAGASKPSLKTRSSLSSITNRKQESPEEAQHKPSITNNEPSKRSSAVGSTRLNSPTKASLGRRSGLGSVTDVNTRSATDRSSTASSAKTVPRKIHPNARSPNSTGTPRSTRPIGYQPQRSTNVSQSNTVEKRLSAISASPPSAHDVISTEAPTEKPTRSTFHAERPKLLARKSTMSDTIEQRLREVELVNKMIKAAMAEDGKDTDEVKEEYGKRADEELAELRSKLEEARRNEGRAPVDADDGRAAKERNVSAKRSDDVAAVEAKLAISQQESEKLRYELSSLRQQLLHADGVNEDGSSNPRNSKVSAYSTEHLTPRTEELMASHVQELATELRLQQHQKMYARDVKKGKELAFAEGLHNSAHLSGFEQQQHDAKIQNRFVGFHAQSSGEELQSLNQSSDEEREGLIRLIKQLKQRLVDQKNERDDMIARKEREHSQQMNELHSLQIHKDQQAAAIAQRLTNESASSLRSCMETIQHLEATALRRTSEFDAQIGIHLQKIQELTAVSTKQAADNASEVQKQNEEINQKQAIIENLQDRVRDIHECKDRELESQRFELTQGHDKAMSNLRFKQEEALLGERDIGAKRIAELLAKHAQEMGDLRAESDTIVEHMKQQHELAQASRDSTDAAHALAKQETENQIRVLKQQVQASDLQPAEARSALQEAKKLLDRSRAKLKKTRAALVWTESCKDDADRLYLRSQREVQKKSDIIFDLKYKQGRDPEYRETMTELREKLDATVKTLNDRETEVVTAGHRHRALVHKLKSGHGQKVKDLKRAIDQLESAKTQLESANTFLTNKAESDKINFEWKLGQEKSINESTSSGYMNELGRRDARWKEHVQKEREDNAALRQKLKQAEEVAEQQAMSLWEAGSALEVAQAELVQLKNQQPDLENETPNRSPYASSPPLTADNHHACLGAASDELPGRNENTGASIIGNMAGMQEQVRQLANSNEEILSNEERICRDMSSLYSPEPLRWLDSTIEEEEKRKED
ncbi:MAG: hypothetical protein Q9191_006071 [Dirinaria sp. TL-2023a]